MKVVALHGIGETYRGGPQIQADWWPALLSGLREFAGPELAPEEFCLVGYGAEFRRSGYRGQEALSARDLDAWEQDMLVLWWQEAARLAAENRGHTQDETKGEEPTLQGPQFAGRARTPALVQRALEQVSRSRFFRGIGSRRILLAGLRQVRLFLYDADIKRAILARVSAAVTPATRVLIGHSLGSVVAYEALCAHPEWSVHTLITLGSPLGISELVFDHLTPQPRDRKGCWPNVARWINVADRGDIVALVKDLAPHFPAPDGASLTDLLVYNGWRSHSAVRYLSTRETGGAIAEALAGQDAP